MQCPNLAWIRPPANIIRERILSMIPSNVMKCILPVLLILASGPTNANAQVVSAEFRDFLQDAFPFNENIAPGSANFDTTTALVKTGRLISDGNASTNDGVILGDSLVYSAAGPDTRMDLIFRIKPGPGNYSTPGDITSPLIEKDILRPFWGSYLNSPNESGLGIGSGNHAGGTLWNPDTWNSARIDTAQQIAFPVNSVSFATVSPGQWMGTLHEEDRHYDTLGVHRNLDFMVNPAGPKDDTNICGSTVECGGAPWFESYPPAVYPGGTSTTTIEGTKVLPDGYFSPGTHIEYYVRRSDASDPTLGVERMFDPFDPSKITAQNNGTMFDNERWSHFDVLPDLWKDVAYGGQGLACMLVVDAADRRGAQRTFLTSLQCTGYGRVDGASQGWKIESDPSNTPTTCVLKADDPAFWVNANLGQYGLSFDLFDITGSEDGQGGHPGCRILGVPISPDPKIVDRQCKAGPTPDMLKEYYNTIAWFQGNIINAIQHGLTTNSPADDVRLLNDFLTTASNGTERAVWLNGENVANGLANGLGDAPSMLATTFGVSFLSDDYRTHSGVNADPAGLVPLIATHGFPNEYGLDNPATRMQDVITNNPPGAPDAVIAARYEDQSDRGNGSPGPFGASVYNPADNISRFYSTLLDGFSLGAVIGKGFADDANLFGRIEWLSDALTAFNLCAPIGPVVSVSGEGPGISPISFIRPAYPNPISGGGTKIRYTVSRPAEVAITFYTVSGQIVRTDRFRAAPDDAGIYEWDGLASDGKRVRPGVYFYRMSSPDLDFDDGAKRIVILQ